MSVRETCSLRQMAPSDLEAVLSIERESFATPWTRGMFLSELVEENRFWLVAEEAGDVVAYGGIMVVGEDAHLMNLAVRVGQRRRGIGRALFEALRHEAASRGAERLTLEVRPSNVEARGLYESEGLAMTGVRPDYYADTDESALIMGGDIRTSARTHLAEQDRDSLLVLAIETSCDETAAAVMRGGRELLASVVASQVDFHARFGGVVPEIASRKHVEAIVAVVDETLARAGEALAAQAGARADAGGKGESAAPLGFGDFDAIAVTYGPGLVGALVVGLAYAKGLAFATGLPLVGVNHLEGHVYAAWLADPDVAPPLVALVVSGGHTSLVHMPEWGVYHTLGETLDDAAGEAFDKVAKVLGLGYPGGPVLSRLAETGDPRAIDFPRAMLHSGDYAFSLSGLKTAVINHIRHEHEAGRDIDVPDLAASFQQAIIDVQVAKAVRAVEEHRVKTFCLAGGVAANAALREALAGALEARGVHVSVPPFALCTDNAAMIAAAGHYRLLRGDLLGLDADAAPSLRLDS